MQILESSMLGLRTARLVLGSSGSNVTVTLFPMVHVGDEAFYRAAYADALAHDVLLFEGVQSPVARRLTRVYRWIDVGRLGLTVQPREALLGRGVARLVHADLSADEFHAEWRRVPLGLRIYLSLAAPVVGLWLRFFATRESIAKRQVQEDLRSEEEILDWTPRWAAFEQSLIHARDARLVECLAREIERAGDAPLRIAIVFGAGHARAVLAYLSRRGFICIDSAWREIIAL